MKNNRRTKKLPKTNHPRKYRVNNKIIYRRIKKYMKENQIDRATLIVATQYVPD